MSIAPRLHGLLAEYDNPEDIVAAARDAYAQGFRRMEAYSPMPVHGLAEAVGFRRTRVPQLVFLGGLTGCIGGYALLTWITVWAYPLNVGGRPLYSWPAYIPITFETTVLAAAITAVFGMLFLNGLPQPHHPVFEAPNFVDASRDRFFLWVEASDPNFDLQTTREFLIRLHHPRQVTEVIY